MNLLFVDPILGISLLVGGLLAGYGEGAFTDKTKPTTMLIAPDQCMN